jgi:hypothetical protein
MQWLDELTSTLPIPESSELTIADCDRARIVFFFFSAIDCTQLSCKKARVSGICELDRRTQLSDTM